jgi:hypothetical protein
MAGLNIITMDKVKEIYFEENSHYPTFIMESGEIKHPTLNGHLNISWQNDKELQQIHHKYKKVHGAFSVDAEDKK